MKTLEDFLGEVPSELQRPPQQQRMRVPKGAFEEMVDAAEAQGSAGVVAAEPDEPAAAAAEADVALPDALSRLELLDREDPCGRVEDDASEFAVACDLVQVVVEEPPDDSAELLDCDEPWGRVDDDDEDLGFLIAGAEDFVHVDDAALRFVFEDGFVSCQ
jgi:hypothetical protein